MLPKGHEKYEITVIRTMMYAIVKIAIFHITNLIDPNI